MSAIALKRLGRAVAAIGMAIVACAGWLKADDNSLAVFGLFLTGVVIGIAGHVIARFGEPRDSRTLRARGTDDHGGSASDEDAA